MLTGAFEQQIVFQVDMLHKVIAEFVKPGVERAPGIAGTLRWADVIGEHHKSLKAVAMIIMLVAHYRNRPLGLAAQSATQHGKENLLFLLHMTLHFLVDSSKQVGKTARASIALAVYLLDAAGHPS